MAKCRVWLSRVRSAFRADDREHGQGMAEYGLILALIAVVCIVGLQTLGVAIAGSAGFTALPISL